MCYQTKYRVNTLGLPIFAHALNSNTETWCYVFSIKVMKLSSSYGNYNCYSWSFLYSSYSSLLKFYWDHSCDSWSFIHFSYSDFSPNNYCYFLLILLIFFIILILLRLFPNQYSYFLLSCCFCFSLSSWLFGFASRSFFLILVLSILSFSPILVFFPFYYFPILVVPF